MLAWLLLGLPFTGIDDADIFFVYARHFAEGHGWVYNIGGERVEGFTSMLWTLIGAGWYSIFQSLETPLFFLNLILGTITVAACLERTHHRATYLLLLAAAPAWFAWCQLTLMESGLWCLLLTLTGLAVADRRHRTVAALLPFLVLTRPESMAWGIWLVLLVFCFAEKGRRMKSAFPVLGSFLLSLGALIGFRLGYFGWPVPNTYYAKVTPDLLTNLISGSGYLFRYLLSGGTVFVLAVILIRVLFGRAAVRGLSFRLALFLLPGFGIPVLVGGDHFGSFRFFQPLWPLLCLIGALEWENQTRNLRLKPAIRAAVLPVLALAGWAVFPMVGNIRHEFRIAKEGRANGAALTRMFEDPAARPTVAVITAGGNKFSYDGPVYDLMGLNSTEMAHAPGDAANFKNHTGFSRDVFYRWQPDILICGDSETFDQLVLNGLHEESRFLGLYQKCTLRRNGAELQAWYRRAFLDGLADGEELTR